MCISGRSPTAKCNSATYSESWLIEIWQVVCKMPRTLQRISTVWACKLIALFHNSNNFYKQWCQQLSEWQVKKTNGYFDDLMRVMKIYLAVFCRRIKFSISSESTAVKFGMQNQNIPPQYLPSCYVYWISMLETGFENFLSTFVVKFISSFHNTRWFDNQCLLFPSNWSRN